MIRKLAIYDDEQGTICACMITVDRSRLEEFMREELIEEEYPDVNYSTLEDTNQRPLKYEIDNKVEEFCKDRLADFKDEGEIGKSDGPYLTSVCIGYAEYDEGGDSTMLDNIHVEPEFRRKGIGAALIQEAVRRFDDFTVRNALEAEDEDYSLTPAGECLIAACLRYGILVPNRIEEGGDHSRPSSIVQAAEDECNTVMYRCGLTRWSDENELHAPAPKQRSILEFFRPAPIITTVPMVVAVTPTPPAATIPDARLLGARSRAETSGYTSDDSDSKTAHASKRRRC